MARVVLLAFKKCHEAPLQPSLGTLIAAQDYANQTATKDSMDASSAHFDELSEAEAKVVRMMEIAASVTDALAATNGGASAMDLKVDVADFLRLVKVRALAPPQSQQVLPSHSPCLQEVHQTLSPKVELLSAYEPPATSVYGADLSARVAGALLHLPIGEES